MGQLFEAQHRASRQGLDVSQAIRRDRLLRLKRLIDEHEADLAAAVQSDFGVRSAQLTQVADMLLLRSMLAQSLKSLQRWMKPEKVATPLHLLPSRAYVMRQPLGVVGVVAPGTTRCSWSLHRRSQPWRPATASCSSPAS